MKSSTQHYFLFLFFSLKCFAFLILSLDYSFDKTEPNEPHIADQLVSHHDCSNQYNLRQYSLTRAQPCGQDPYSLESTRGIASIFERAKAKRLKAWTCEAYVKREVF